MRQKKRALEQYYNHDVRMLTRLPRLYNLADYLEGEEWGRYMQDEMRHNPKENLALLDVVNYDCYMQTNELFFFSPAEMTKDN